jgi:polysaccharide pyruvyl transferase WcaK-like protein
MISRSSNWFPRSKIRGLVRRVLGHNAGAPQAFDQPPMFDKWTDPIGPARASNPPGPTLVVLNDCRDQVNLGANALIDGLIEILSRSLPSATMMPIPSHWLIEAEFLHTFVNNGVGLHQPRVEFPYVCDQFETVADEWMAGRGGPDAGQYLDRFAAADLLVVNGEGSLYRRNQSAVRELFLAWLCKTRLGVPTIFVNGTSHLTDVDPVLPPMVRKSFGALDAVAVREPPSYRNLRHYAPDVETRYIPDTAFVFTPNHARETAAVRRIRAEIGPEPHFYFDPSPMPMDDRAGTASALHQMISALQRVVPKAVFVSTGPGDDYIEGVARETGSVFVSWRDGIADYREWMALVKDAQFLVTGRYHNAIMAAIMGRPSITFASASHKVHGACEMLEGLVGSPYDPTDLRPRLRAIEEHARSYLQNRDQLQDRLREACTRRRSEALGLGQLAADVVRRRAGGLVEDSVAVRD